MAKVIFKGKEIEAYEHPGFITALSVVSLISRLGLRIYSNHCHSFNNKFFITHTEQSSYKNL